MSRYIDADKLLTVLPDDLPYKASVKRVLIQAPPADVVEVRHGEWKVVDSDIGYVELECSLCGHKYLSHTEDGLPYCSGCGAKMDGERSENDNT